MGCTYPYPVPLTSPPPTRECGMSPVSWAIHIAIKYKFQLTMMNFQSFTPGIFSIDYTASLSSSPRMKRQAMKENGLDMTFYYSKFGFQLLMKDVVKFCPSHKKHAWDFYQNTRVSMDLRDFINKKEKMFSQKYIRYQRSDTVCPQFQPSLI